MGEGDGQGLRRYAASRLQANLNRCILRCDRALQWCIWIRDNVEMPYAGIRYDALSSAQQALLLELIETYVGTMRPGHAEVRMAEVKGPLRDTYFAWMGVLRSGP